MGIGSHIWRMHGEGKDKNLLTEESKLKISSKLKGDLNPSKKKKNREKISQGLKNAHAEGKMKLSESKKKIVSEKISKKLKGNKNAKYTSGKKIEYRNYTLKSSWEYEVAKYLDNNGYIWKYEEITYSLDKKSSYTPDFFIYDEKNNLLKLIEVKGYLREYNKIKLEKFNNLYDIDLEIWDGDILREKNIL